MRPSHSASAPRSSPSPEKWLAAPQDTIALDVGTSVLALARELVGRPDLKFLTNNLPAAMSLSGGPSPVYLLGGQLRGPEMSVIGTAATEQARSYYVDRATGR